ncbi:MAG: hypothetical protein N2712_06290 [Brevinematales bacterium]|nr:hypothetical protein [Brevinematales bacterium]
MKVVDLIERGIPEKIASFLISHFSDDPEKIYLVINSLKKDIVVIKLKFSFSLYSGIALLFVNIKSKNIEFVRAYVSHSAEITKINIETFWRDLLLKLSNEYKNLQVDLDLSRKAENVLTSDSKFIQTLAKVLSEDKTQLDIKRFLYTYIPIIFGDPNTIVRFSVDRTDIFYLYKFMKESNIPLPETLKSLEGDQINEFSISDISVQPVLSPIDGVPITNLRIGDEIMVKILDTDEISKSFIKGDGTTFTKISSIRDLDSDRVLVSVEVGPGFIGNFAIKKDVKIKTKLSPTPNVEKQKSDYQPQITQKPEVEERTSHEIENLIEKEKDTSLLFWIINITIIGFGIALILILLVFL